MANTLGKRNPFRYRGYVWDEETGLYYLRSRYYNPELGRFLNADVLLGNIGQKCSHNIFAYAMNAPIVFSDPNGERVINSIVGLIGAMVGVVTNAYDNSSFYLSEICMNNDVIDLTDQLNAEMQKNYEYMSSYLESNTKKYGAMVAFAMANLEFAKKVRTGGEWDLKHTWNLKKELVYKYNDIEITYQDPGNIHYGYVGSALYELTDLHLFAGEYQIISKTSDWSYWSSLFDDPDDYAAVTYGYLLKQGTYSTVFTSYSLNP